MLILRQPCLGRVAPSPARGDGDGHNVNRYFWAFVLWRLSPVVYCASSERAEVAESQPLSQNREIAVCSPLSSSGHFNSLSLGAAKNPAAGISTLTSRAGMSLSFVFLTLPSGSRPRKLPSSLSQHGSHALRSASFQSGCTRTPKLPLSVGFQ